MARVVGNVKNVSATVRLLEEIVQAETRRALGLLASEFARLDNPGLSRDLWDATVKTIGRYEDGESA